MFFIGKVGRYFGKYWYVYFSMINVFFLGMIGNTTCRPNVVLN